MRISQLNPLNCLDFLLQVKSEDREGFEVFLWWEFRRILYNIIVGVIGFCALIVIWTFVPTHGSQDIPEPMAIVVFAVLCNVCYCLGWFTELMLQGYVTDTGKVDSRFNPGKKYGPICFKLGLGLTLLVIFLGTICAIILNST